MSDPRSPALVPASNEHSDRVLALNCGSSTVKFAVFCGDQPAPILHGNAEALETEAATFRWTVGPETKARSMPGAGHREAIEALVGWIADAGLSLGGIGHRVVHGGEFFAAPARVDADVLQRIEQLCALAPLHNPANLLGIRLMSERFPALPQLAVFDTAFHQTLPPKAYHYALPAEFYKQHRVRRYGFHGTSHQWVAQEAALRLRRPLAELQLLVVHLGNGCSACAIRDGRSVDTTMGLTPMEGMMMGTRSGDVDPSLHQFLATQTGRSLEEITHLLNRQSGLFGVSGVSNDRRVLEERMRAGSGWPPARSRSRCIGCDPVCRSWCGPRSREPWNHPARPKRNSTI